MPDSELGISVVITTYNEGRYLKDLLDSFVKQQGPMEVLLVDSMSTDETESVVREFQNKHNFLRYIRQQCSRGEGRNIGVKNASYDHVLFTDGDAIANPFWLRKMRETFREGYDVVAGKTIQMGYEPFEKLGRVELYFEDFEVTSPSVNLGYSKKLFQEIGGFDVNFITAEDIDLNIRAVKAGGKIGFCEDCIIYHRTKSTFVGFIEQAFWNGFGRKQLNNKHLDVWSHFRFSEIFKPDVINFWYVVRAATALLGYTTCKLFGDDFAKRRASGS